MGYDLNFSLSLRSVPNFLLAAIVLTIPLPDYMVNNILIVIAVLYSLFTCARSPIRSAVDLILFMPGLLLLLFLFGLFWTEDLSEGWSQVEKRLPLLALGIMSFFLRKRLLERDIYFIFYTFVLLCFLLTLICYTHALLEVIRNQSFKVTSLTERNYYYFSYLYLTRPVRMDPIYLSLYINFSVVILLLKPLRRPSWLTHVIISYFILFQLLIASKIGIACLAVVLIVHLGSTIKNRYAALTALTLLTVFLVYAVLGFSFLKERFVVKSEFSYKAAYSGEWNSFSQRLAIWSCAIEAIKRTFPLGYGTSDGQKALESIYRERNYVRGYEDQYNAHNEFLYTTLDLGLPGLSYLLILLGIPLIVAIKKKHKLLIYFHILLILYSLVEVILARRQGIIFYSLFYPLLVLMPFSHVTKTETSDGI